MKNPLVSFILGILDAERTIKECLEGILMQDYKNYEIIIVDGGSKDKTLEIVKSFMRSHKNIKLLHNSKKLSEGKGMSKDMGVQSAKGDIVIFLDHDNILLDKNWLKEMLFPFEEDKEIMATQSLLKFRESDSQFLKYINAMGVEDPFAVPYSLVSQVVLYPKNFELIKDRYYIHNLNKNKVLFAGANGAAFKKIVFKKIGGYTRDVDVYASMASFSMKVAVVKNAKLYHATSSNLWTYLKKKGIYFHRFIDGEYATKQFQWIPTDFSGKLRFYLMVASNLSIFPASIVAIRQFFKTGRLFWFIHPGALFFMTLEYGLITLMRFRNFLDYGKKN